MMSHPVTPSGAKISANPGWNRSMSSTCINDSWNWKWHYISVGVVSTFEGVFPQLLNFVNESDL